MSFNRYYLLAFLLFTSLLCSNCSTLNSTEIKEDSVPFTISKTGVLYGAGDEGIPEGIVVVKKMEELEAVLLKMNSVNMTISEKLVSDPHFFDQKMLLFVFDKVRGSGGYQLQSQRIIRSSDQLLVEVLITPPTGPATSVMTQPFQVIEIDQSELPVVVRFI